MVYPTDISRSLVRIRVAGLFFGGAGWVGRGRGGDRAEGYEKKKLAFPSTRQPSFQRGLSGLLSFDCSRQRLMAARFPASPGAPLIITHDSPVLRQTAAGDPELRIGKPSTRRTGLRLNAG